MPAHALPTGHVNQLSLPDLEPRGLRVLLCWVWAGLVCWAQWPGFVAVGKNASPDTHKHTCSEARVDAHAALPGGCVGQRPALMQTRTVRHRARSPFRRPTTPGRRELPLPSRCLHQVLTAPSWPPSPRAAWPHFLRVLGGGQPVSSQASSRGADSEASQGPPGGPRRWAV